MLELTHWLRVSGDSVHFPQTSGLEHDEGHNGERHDEMKMLHSGKIEIQARKEGSVTISCTQSTSMIYAGISRSVLICYTFPSQSS